MLLDGCWRIQPECIISIVLALTRTEIWFFSEFFAYRIFDILLFVAYYSDCKQCDGKHFCDFTLFSTPRTQLFWNRKTNIKII